jgi:hypothetical protein
MDPQLIDELSDPVDILLRPDPPKVETEADKARLPVKSNRKGRSPEAMAVMRERAAAARKVNSEKKALEREADFKEAKARILKAEQEAKAIEPVAEEEGGEEEEAEIVAKPKRVAKRVKKVVQVVEDDDDDEDYRHTLKQYIKEKAKKYVVKYGGKPTEPSTVIKENARDHLRSQLSDQVLKAAYANVFRC